MVGPSELLFIFKGGLVQNWESTSLDWLSYWETVVILDCIDVWYNPNLLYVSQMFLVIPKKVCESKEEKYFTRRVIMNIIDHNIDP